MIDSLININFLSKKVHNEMEFNFQAESLLPEN